MWSYTYPSRAQSEQLQTTRMTAMLVGMVNAAERIPLVSYMPFAGTVTEWAKNATNSEDDDDDNDNALDETSSDDGRLEHSRNDTQGPLPEPSVSFSTPLPRKNTFATPNPSIKIEEDQDTPSRLPSLPRPEAKRSLRSSISTPNLHSKYAAPPPPYQPSLSNPTESITDPSKQSNGSSASASLRERLKLARLSMPLFGSSEPAHSAPASPISDTKSFTSRRPSSTPSSSLTDLPKIGINRRSLDQAITLAKIAAAEDEKGNTQLALDLYLTGLEQMLSAYPLTESSARRALDSKIRSFCDRNHLSDNSIALASQAGPSRLAQLSDLVINLAIFIAITIKQSPLPDTLHTAFKISFRTLQSLDDRFSLSGRAWDLTASGVNKALEIDAKYNLHQMFSQALLTTAAAIVKAGIAYKDSPSWKDAKSSKDIGKLDAVEFADESLQDLLSELGRRGSAV